MKDDGACLAAQPRLTCVTAAARLIAIALAIMVAGTGCDRSGDNASASREANVPPDPAGESPALSKAGSSSPRPEAWFEEIAEANGLVFRHVSGHRERYYIPEITVGGAALFDMDGDGDLDA